MDIDLSLLHSNTISEIDISNIYNIPKIYFENSDALALDNIKVQGKIYQKETEVNTYLDYVDAHIEGTMKLQDSISLEPIDYPFSIIYNDILEENCKKNENTLDIFQFLWENIVLEVPLQFTKVADLSKFHGDGWKLISEEDLITKNNPFSELLEDKKEE